MIENENVPQKASFRQTEGQKMVEGPGVLCPTKESSSSSNNRFFLDLSLFLFLNPFQLPCSIISITKWDLTVTSGPLQP